MTSLVSGDYSKIVEDLLRPEPFQLTSPLTPGRRLRFCRENAGLSQKELARATGLHPTLLSAMENDRRDIHLMAAIRLAKPLKQNYRDLLSDPTEDGSETTEPTSGQKLATLRAAQGWTQKDLSRISGLSYQSLSSIESCYKGLGNKSYTALAAAFGLSVEEMKRQLESDNDLPRRLRRARKTRGWTQEKLAEASGLSLDTVSRIESGVQNPTEVQIKAICAAYGIDPADI